MTTLKTCLYCGEPIVGRADKRYCNNACKSRDFREQGGARKTVVINTVAPHLPAKALGEPRSYSGKSASQAHQQAAPAPTLPPTDPSESVRNEAAVPAPPPAKPIEQQIQETIDTILARGRLEDLHRDYCKLIETFLEKEGISLAVSKLWSLKYDANSLIARYREHPQVKEASDLHRQRLDDLYTVLDVISEAHVDAQQQPFWKERESSYELKDKQRRKMRERLIG